MEFVDWLGGFWHQKSCGESRRDGHAAPCIPKGNAMSDARRMEIEGEPGKRFRI